MRSKLRSAGKTYFLEQDLARDKISYEIWIAETYFLRKSVSDEADLLETYFLLHLATNVTVTTVNFTWARSE